MQKKEQKNLADSTSPKKAGKKSLNPSLIKYEVEHEQLYSTTIWHEVFAITFCLFWSKDQYRLTEYIKRNHNGSRDDIAEIHGLNCGQVCFVKWSSDIIPIISMCVDWQDTSQQIALLSHEVLHAVIGLMRIRNIPLPKDIHYASCDEENLCYHDQWLMERCLDALRNQDQYKANFSEESPIEN